MFPLMDSSLGHFFGESDCVSLFQGLPYCERRSGASSVFENKTRSVSVRRRLHIMNLRATLGDNIK